MEQEKNSQVEEIQNTRLKLESEITVRTILIFRFCSGKKKYTQSLILLYILAIVIIKK